MNKRDVYNNPYAKTLNKFTNLFKGDFNYFTIKQSSSEDMVTILSSCLYFLIEFEEYFQTEEEAVLIRNRFMKVIKEFIESTGNNTSLSMYTGLIHIAYPIYLLTQKTGEYRNFLAQLNNYMCERAEEELDRCITNIDNVKITDFDFIYGMTGIANYFMNFSSNKKFNDLLCCICL